MSRGDWDAIKKSKFFYVQSFRRLKKWIIFFQGLNILLCLLMGYFYWNRPQQVFYATNGETSPIRLAPLNAPNSSAEALLPPDPAEENEIKAVPE